MFTELSIEADIWEAAKSSDAILVADDAGIITWITATCEKMFGYNIRNELVGKAVHILVAESMRAGHPTLFASFWKEPSARPMGVERILDGQHRDGHTFKVSVNLVPWMIGGKRQVKASIAEMSGATKK